MKITLKRIYILLLFALIGCNNDNNQEKIAPYDEKQLYFSTEGMKEFVLELPVSLGGKYTILIDAQFYFDIENQNMEIVLKEYKSEVNIQTSDTLVEFYGNQPLSTVIKDPTSYNYSFTINKGVEGIWSEKEVATNCTLLEEGRDVVDEKVIANNMIQYQSDTSLFFINLWDVIVLMEEEGLAIPLPSSGKIVSDSDYGQLPNFNIYQNLNVSSLERCE